MLSCVKRDGGIPRFPANTVHPPELADCLASLCVQAHELTGEEILPFVPEGHKVDQDSDKRLSVLSKHLAEMVSTHNVASAVMEETQWDFMAVYYTAIDHFCHSFVSYHPPQLPWISDADFEIYRHVIEAVYRFIDMTLGRMI